MTGVMMAAAALFLSAIARGADPTVSATLSQPAAEVGQAVQFQIEVSGKGEVRVPGRIAVAGLSISYAGQSFKQQMSFGTAGRSASESVIYIYQVVPQRAGRFVIPPQAVEINGKQFTTNAVTLEAGGGAAAAAPEAEQNSEARNIFAELVVPKQKAFVGEVIPFEFRIYVDHRIRWRTEQPPVINGEGFTVQKLSKPAQNQVTRDGRVYDLVTFKTAGIAAKTGKLTLGPAELACIAQLPQQRRQRNSPFDNFFNDDVFADVFGFGQPQQVKITSEPVEIEIAPLPPKPPNGFSGAVGQFTLEATARPTKVKAGDPVTITAKISGRGNFDRMDAPQIVEESGWRAYPPSGKFVPDDDVGISGTKTFEAAVIPEEKKTKLPALQFSYFDPADAKYKTLQAAQTPIEVAGAAVATAAATPNARTNSTPAPLTAATPAPADILYLRTDDARWGQSFRPIYQTRGFWLAQLAPLTALLAFAAFQIAGTRRQNASAMQMAEWRREKSGLMKTLARRDLDEATFFSAAAQCLRLEAAIRSGRNPQTMDAEEVSTAAHLDAAQTESVRGIFAANAELRYAAAGRGEPLSAAKREEILQIVRRFSS